MNNLIAQETQLCAFKRRLKIHRLKKNVYKEIGHCANIRRK